MRFILVTTLLFINLFWYKERVVSFFTKYLLYMSVVSVNLSATWQFCPFPRSWGGERFKSKRKPLKLMNGDLHTKGCHGLLQFSPCTLHVVQNSFHKGFQTLKQDVEQLAFNLYRWFKISPYRQEDFINVSESTNIQDEPLFIYYTSACWLTIPTWKNLYFTEFSTKIY